MRPRGFRIQSSKINHHSPLPVLIGVCLYGDNPQRRIVRGVRLLDYSKLTQFAYLLSYLFLVNPRKAILFCHQGHQGQVVRDGNRMLFQICTGKFMAQFSEGLSECYNLHIRR